jgi:16S rRNA (guanine(966)-N(2))-methyltransferase RsmD
VRDLRVMQLARREAQAWLDGAGEGHAYAAGARAQWAQRLGLAGVAEVRVIAGRLKGRRLEGPGWDGLRPTSDALRETLFNILGARVDGAVVLDGYAGTGALGIEALSRGAGHVTFVERDRRALALIARNLSACGVSGGYTIVPSGVETMAVPPAGQRYDIVLLDPPYATGPLGDVLARVEAALADGGVVVLEHAARAVPPRRAGGLALTRRVKAGDSALGFYVVSPPGESEAAWEENGRVSPSTRGRSTR